MGKKALGLFETKKVPCYRRKRSSSRRREHGNQLTAVPNNAGRAVPSLSLSLFLFLSKKDRQVRDCRYFTYNERSVAHWALAAIASIPNGKTISSNSTENRKIYDFENRNKKTQKHPISKRAESFPLEERSAAHTQKKKAAFDRNNGAKYMPSEAVNPCKWN